MAKKNIPQEMAEKFLSAKKKNIPMKKKKDC